MDIPQNVSLTAAIVSGLAAIAQTIRLWQRGRIDIEKIRQDLTLDLIGKIEKSDAERERRNGVYIQRLAEEKEAILSVNHGLQKELGRLRERVRILEARDRMREAEVGALREERGELQKRVCFLEDEVSEWKARYE